MKSQFLRGILLTSALVSAPAVAADWPNFRGNALQSGIATSGLPDELEIRWKFKTKDSIEGTAAIVGDTVFIGSMDEHLYAFDLETGKEKWKYKAGPFKAAPSVRDGLIYIGDCNGVFHCIDSATGGKRWEFKTENEQEISSGANFAAGNIIFGCGDETLYCVSKDGKERWRFKVPGGPVLGSPVVAGDRTFAAGCDSSLHVIDIATGKEVGTPLDLGGQVGATPAVIGDMLYVGTMSQQVLAINWKKMDVVWRFEPERHKQAFYSSAAVTDKLVVLGGRNKKVHALDRNTGSEAWSFDTKNRVDSSPVVVENRVFVGSNDKYLYELDLQKGTERKKYLLEGEVTGSPAVSGNCLIIGAGDGTVYCFGAKR